MNNRKRLRRQLCREPKPALVPIDVPHDIGEKAERAVRQLGKYEAACVWCAHGYAEYTRKAEDEHFAYNCPDAPQELRENAIRRLLLGDYDDDCCESEEEPGDKNESR